MGLAASQVRLLMLTSRKDDVESQLSKIANEKLSLSRQSAKAAQEYNDALNATKLTWDADTGSAVDLNYDLLMKPNTSVYENHYLIRNTAGAVVLDEGYISKLGIAGSGTGNAIGQITATDSTGTYSGETAFLMRMMDITAETAKNYMTTNQSTGGNTSTSGTSCITSYSDTKVLIAATNSTKTDFVSLFNGTTQLWHDSDRDTSHNPFDGPDYPDLYGDACGAQDSIRNNFGSLLTTIAGGLESGLKSVIENSMGTGNNLDSKISSACDWAYYATYNKFLYNKTNTIADGDGAPDPILGTGDVNIRNSGESGNTGDASDGNNGLVYTYSHHEGGWGCNDTKTTNASVYVNNAEIMDTYLDFFDYYFAKEYGYDGNNDHSKDSTNSYSPQNILARIGGTSTSRADKGGTGPKCSTTNTTTPTDGNDTSGIIGVSDSYEASFYISLYWAIYSSGWEENSNIGNEQYMQNQLLYGNITIDKLDSSANDGKGVTTQVWDPLSLSDSDCPINKTTDKDAVAKAEAKYEAEKDLVDSKEAQLDLQSNDLDTERSALTTEIDSVNSILKKNIDSSFKYFDSSG